MPPGARNEMLRLLEQQKQEAERRESINNNLDTARNYMQSIRDVYVLEDLNRLISNVYKEKSHNDLLRALTLSQNVAESAHMAYHHAQHRAAELRAWFDEGTMLYDSSGRHMLIRTDVLDPGVGMRGDVSQDSSRRMADTITGIVLHHDGGASDRTASTFRANTATRQSEGYHFVIGYDGSIAQLVPINETAWHSGRRGVQTYTLWDTRPNSTTIGITFLTPGTTWDGRNVVFPDVVTINATLPSDAQLDSLVYLTAHLIANYDVEPRITTHDSIVRTSTEHCPPVFSPVHPDNPAEYWPYEERFDDFIERVSEAAGIQVTGYLRGR